jgi:hypothetical protein
MIKNRVASAFEVPSPWLGITAVGLLAASLGYAQSPPQAQNRAAPATAAAPANQRLIEEQRRLNSAHRRRAREAIQNAENAQLLLAAGQTATAAAPPGRTMHRGANRFRQMTPLGRRAVQPAPLAAPRAPGTPGAPAARAVAP